MTNYPTTTFERARLSGGRRLGAGKERLHTPGNLHRPSQDGMVLRAVDLMLASAALLFFAPLMVLVTFAIWAHDGGPAIFRHMRVGKDGKRFFCLKFRSMAADSDRRLQALLASDASAREEWMRDQKLLNDPRVTKLGRILRVLSIDELPQLVNVLRGEMSLVGPRPIVPAEAARYGPYFRYYCLVRPGITGLWQISGRNDVSYKRRVALDTLYAQRISVGLNLKILAGTVPAVLLRRGAR